MPVDACGSAKEVAFGPDPDGLTVAVKSISIWGHTNEDVSNGNFSHRFWVKLSLLSFSTADGVESRICVMSVISAISSVCVIMSMGSLFVLVIRSYAVAIGRVGDS